MAKSICNGCKHWEFLDDGLGLRFYYCNKFGIHDLETRKIKCRGKYYESKRINVRRLGL